ncbi:MAG: hypothetical protein M1115_11570 [Actinobacteria bacterium]|nr:hypothetical protein [Actinomycetota bacterium]
MLDLVPEALELVVAPVEDPQAVVARATTTKIPASASGRLVPAKVAIGEQLLFIRFATHR